jgi:hypothetical protein
MERRFGQLMSFTTPTSNLLKLFCNFDLQPTLIVETVVTTGETGRIRIFVEN